MQPNLETVEQLAAAPLLSGVLSPLERYGYLLEGADKIPPPRLPQDYSNGIFCVGIMNNGNAYAVCSNREIVSAEQFGAVNYGLTNVRFSKDGLKRFLRGDAITGPDLLHRLEQFIRRFVVMGEDLRPC